MCKLDDKIYVLKVYLCVFFLNYIGYGGFDDYGGYNNYGYGNDGFDDRMRDGRGKIKRYLFLGDFWYLFYNYLVII